MKIRLQRRYYSQEQTVSYILRSFLGIGKSNVLSLLGLLGITRSVKATSISLLQVAKLDRYIYKKCLIGIRLKRLLANNFRFLYQLQNYKGIRLRLALPINGQRTRTNASTAKKLNRGWLKKFAFKKKKKRMILKGGKFQRTLKQKI